MEDGRSPFTDDFLTQHDVTLDEVYALSESLAHAGRLYLRLLETGRGALVAEVLVEELLDRMDGSAEVLT